MQVSYSEGLANRTDPESCVGVREDAGEALTGERIGQSSSVCRSSTRKESSK